MIDLLDWADVAAVGVLTSCITDPSAYAAFDSLIAGTVADLEYPTVLAEHRAIAAALREAFEAGLREGRRERARFTPAETAERMLMVKDIVEDEHRTLLADLRALRRELAARRAVDGWLRASSYLRAIAINADGDVAAGVEGADQHWHTVAKSPTYPALAAALGLEVEE